MSNLEKSIILGILVAWLQLVCGQTAHAFFSLGAMMLMSLIGIMIYLREI